MLELARIVHFLSFSIGIGIGVAGMVIGMRARAAPAEMRPVLGRIQMVLGRTSFVAVVLLWVTGFYMVYAVYGGWGGFGTLLWLKIAAVVVLTACSIALQVNAIRAMRAGTPPPAKRMAKLGATATTSAVVALVLAVLAFA